MHGFINGAARPHLVARVGELPPHNRDAERALLGALLVDNKAFAEVSGTLDAEDFYLAEHGTIWAAIAERIGAGELADAVTLKGALGETTYVYLGTLVANATTTMNVAEYARIVKDAATRRRAMEVGERLIAEARDATLALKDVLQATVADIGIVRGGIASGEAPVIARCVADVEATPVRWLWPGRFPLAKMSILAGEPGCGKSQITCAMAAAATTGGTWPDGSRAPLGSVVFICCEDDASDTIRPRLEAAGADLCKVHLLDWVLAGGERRHFDVGAHVEALTRLVQRIGDVKLIVIDPVSAFMGRADSHVVAEVRAALWPLQAMASELGPAIILVSHLNKSSSANGAMSRVSGSGAFVAACRGAWMVGKDPADETKRRRLMLPLKLNIGADDSTGFAYAIQPWSSGAIESSCIRWEAGVVTASAEDLLRPATHHDDGGAVAEAEMFLRAELADGPKPSSWVDTAAKGAGISKRAIERARKQLGITATKDSSGRWHVSLPPSARKH